MRSATIATLIEYFNIASIIVLAVLALFGVMAIINKKLRGRLPFLSAFGVAALAAFALEATAFNFFHYLKYFAGPPTAIAGVSATDPNVLMTTDGAQVELIENRICFRDLNRKVASVYIEFEFGDMEVEVKEAYITWTDEGSTQTYVKRFYKYLPHENYAPIQPCGKVSELNVAFTLADPSYIALRKLAINEPIPFYFSGLRLLVVSLALFALLALINKNLRAKTAYYMFEYEFDPKNKKQNAVYACMVALLLLFSWVCVYTSFDDRSEENPIILQYNKFLVDALIAGRTYLDYGNPEVLLTTERPYDHIWRRTHGDAEKQFDLVDWAWYKGKYYCYFGVVPAVLLYVPYKMITGNYLSYPPGVFLFCVIAVILLAMLWRYCVKKYMPDIRYALYLLSFLTLFFVSGLSFTIFRHPILYTLTQSSGFMFTVAGVLLLLKSVDNGRIHYIKLFFACLCLALVFGCRPNMGLASLLVPVVLWKYGTWKSFAFAVLPYVIVAVPLCLYNYVRFDSIFQFGLSYNLTGVNTAALAQQNILGKIFRTFVCLGYYLFYPVQFSMYFPFVNEIPYKWVMATVVSGVVYAHQDAVGIVNFPIFFLLFYIFKNIFSKNKPKTFYLLSAFLIIAAAIMVLNAFFAGVASRYVMDFAIFIVLPACFCAYYWCQDRLSGGEDGGDAARLSALRARLGLTYGLMAASIFVGQFISVSIKYTYSNPTLYRYLECSLGFFGNG